MSVEIIVKATTGPTKLTIKPERGCAGSDGYIHLGLFPEAGDCNAIVVSAKELHAAVDSAAKLAKN